MRPLLALVMLATGCVEYRGYGLVVDLSQKTATLTLRDVRGDGDDDLKTLVKDLLPGKALTAELPGAVPKDRRLVVEGDVLNAVADVTFAEPSDVAVGTWDGKIPYRYCPMPGFAVTSANATWRDADGCVIWPAEARILRVEAEAIGTPKGGSLLPAFQAWEEKGRPEWAP